MRSHTFTKADSVAPVSLMKLCNISHHRWNLWVKEVRRLDTHTHRHMHTHTHWGETGGRSSVASVFSCWFQVIFPFGDISDLSHWDLSDPQRFHHHCFDFMAHISASSWFGSPALDFTSSWISVCLFFYLQLLDNVNLRYASQRCVYMETVA